jgi:hypothetical protein
MSQATTLAGVARITLGEVDAIHAAQFLAALLVALEVEGRRSISYAVIDLACALRWDTESSR